jgi:hypothetical protein
MEKIGIEEVKIYFFFSYNGKGNSQVLNVFLLSKFLKLTIDSKLGKNYTLFHYL